MPPYPDRRAAGRVLAQLLADYAHAPHGLVLALPRGGVPVGYEIAHALALPLDVFVVRKVGAPTQPELAVGAVASGGMYVLNEHVIAQLGLSGQELEPLIHREFVALAEREQHYRSTRGALDVAGKTIIVTDDGLATGASMRAALQALRTAHPARLVVAVPVGAAETVARLRPLADEIVCPSTPSDFAAVGEWYTDFNQISDEEVARLLADS